MAAELKLIAGGGPDAPSGQGNSFPGLPGEKGTHSADGRGVASPRGPSTIPSSGNGPPPLQLQGRNTLVELFATPRDGGWIGFLLAQLPPGKPWLWVQQRMAVLEAGRLYPPGLGAGAGGLIHVVASDPRDALWAMEEGLRCPALGAVIGELHGDPAALDFTATRRLAVAAERSGVAAFLIRLGGQPNLSGARLRWRVASAASLANPFNPRAPGLPAWEAELFRTRFGRPGRWLLSHEPGGAEAGLRVVAVAGDRTLDEARQAAG